MGFEARLSMNRIDLNTVSLRSLIPEGTRILGVLHAGGPAPGSNAAIAGVVRTAESYGISVVAFEDGFAGIRNGRAVILTPNHISRIQSLGGVDIGTSRYNPQKDIGGITGRLSDFGITEGLIGAGGDDTNTTLARMASTGYPTVGIAKTIDNDIPGTSITYGFETVVNAIAEGLRGLKRDACAQGDFAIFDCDIMGRKSGAMTLSSSDAGEATFFAIPEEYSLQGIQQIMGTSFARQDMLLERLSRILRVKGETLGTNAFIRAMQDANIEADDIKLDASNLAQELASIIDRRNTAGLPYAVFTFGEGVVDRLPVNPIEWNEDRMPTKFEVLGFGREVTLGVDDHHNPRFVDVKLASLMMELIQEATAQYGIKSKMVHEPFGYRYRCIDPIASDINLASSLGSQAVEMLVAGEYGKMAAVTSSGVIGGVSFDSLPKDADGHLIPRCVDLGSAQYRKAINATFGRQTNPFLTERQ